jgi:hypothetical protein
MVRAENNSSINAYIAEESAQWSITAIVLSIHRYL